MLRSYAAASPLTPADSQGPLLSVFSQLNLTCALGVGGAVNILAIYHSQAFFVFSLGKIETNQKNNKNLPRNSPYILFFFPPHIQDHRQGKVS